jgi:regulator of nucleoside diphosphate kinase
MEEREKGEVMKQSNILITGPDMEKLRHLLDSLRASANQEQQHLVMLEEELDRARMMPPFEVPPDVVTMNSKVRLTDLQSGKKLTYTLVFPRDANFDQGKISIVAPIGTAILGYRTGDVIEWKVPAGMRRLRVEEILHQPEAADRAARARTVEGSQNADMGRVLQIRAAAHARKTMPSERRYCLPSQAFRAWSG